ncbi:hypothetical protein RN346_06140 [Halomonas sp. PAMB 3232]|uniref:hypothetical protein n=1 Tax=Halomonas sp. PAMB 3232 TaxID=3075221 RepID=UPI00289FE95B|nr:hypothetical protein [Halomonas sp. PAMB 3232]WNL40141.1 hypothetical protein RN346_06140 [Halomonas sp. PAMB 3232]
MLAFRIVLLAGLAALAGCGDTATDLPRVAHAGGGVNNWAYTNTFEALDFNRDHFELFEIDLSWTADDQLVCVHDWQYNAEYIFQRRFDTRPTLAEFEQLVSENPYVKNCTLDTLVEWLKAHPGKRLVPDIKERELEGLARIAERFDQVGDHVIAQMYDPAQYEQIRALGYRDIIWGLYKVYLMPLDEIIDHANDMELFAVSMPRRMAERGDGKALGEAGIATYVHTVNTQRELEYYRSRGVDDIYTDWLAP